MPTLNDPTQSQAIGKFFYSQNDGESITWLGYIRVGNENDTSGEDAISVLNRKLEANGVFATGTSDPVFANETALFYRNTTSNKLFTRGTSSYEEIEAGQEGANIVGHGTTDPAAASATTPWLYVRTDQNKVWIKEKDGSTYSWTGPIFEGTARTLIVYNTQDTPGILSVSWNWQTDTLSPSGGGWTGNEAGAKWARIITGPRNSNNALVSPLFRVGDPTTFTAKDGTNNIPSSVNTLQELVDWLDTWTPTSGGGNVNQMPADWDATTGVTRILNKPDVPPFYEDEFTRTGSPLDTLNETQDQAFTIPTDLQTDRDRYGDPLFIRANVNIVIEPTVDVNPDTLDFNLSVVTSAGAALTPEIISQTITLSNTTGRTTATARVIGILPNDFNGGLLRVTATRINNHPLVGVRYFRLRVDPSRSADDIVVKNNDLGNNLTPTGLTTVEDLVSQIDELPIQPSDYEDVGWPGGSNGVDQDGDGSPVRRTIPIHRNIQNVITRPGHHYIARISYDSNYIHGSGTGVTSINFTHNVYSNVTPGTAIATENISAQGVTPTNRVSHIDIPTNATELTVEFVVPNNQSDARLNVANYHVDFFEGINASGFTADNRILSNNTRTVQLLAQAVYEATAANIPVDSSSFGTNLQVADNTIQLVANRLNSLVLGTNQNAAQVPIAINPAAFADPNNFIGGMRGYSESGYETNPNDVRAALRVTDRRLEEAYNPYQYTQLLDHFTGGSFSSSFIINSATEILSSDIDIPQAVRELGTSAAVRLRINIQALGTGWVGDVRLVHSDYGTGSPRITTTYGDPEAINNTAYSTGDTISFQRILTAPLPDTFKIRFRRTGGTTSSTFNEGFADVIDSTNGGSGGAGGQTAGYTTNIIWLAGASIYDRLITASETTNYTLMAGHSFSAYNQLAFVFDGGAGSTQPLMQVWSDSNLYQAFGAAGLLDIKGNWWLMTSRQSDRTFRFRWRGANNGLRRIVGIRT